MVSVSIIDVYWMHSFQQQKPSCLIPWCMHLHWNRKISAKTVINRVLTFDKTNQNWYNPDLLSVRSRPGVVTHTKSCCCCWGNKSSESGDCHDDIEVRTKLDRELSLEEGVHLSSSANELLPCMILHNSEIVMPIKYQHFPLQEQVFSNHNTTTPPSYDTSSCSSGFTIMGSYSCNPVWLQWRSWTGTIITQFVAL